ncbi:hypothetical protein RSOL_003390, partial [Rhizoctonia solani AG-3 Rhs1AP]
MTIFQDDDMIETDDGDRPQLVHSQKYIERPSRLIRFASRLGLTKASFLVDSYHTRNLDAAEMLAKHLHDGTRPSDLSRVQSQNEGDVSSGRIPIHCVVVSGLDKPSVSERNDELKSRLPPGIEHIMCWSYRDEFQSSATRYDADGSMISKEICISRGDDKFELRWHCTKHVIYYKEDEIPKWENHKPVWTHKLDSSPSDVQGGLPLEATKPFGMYMHELRKYQDLPGHTRNVSMLVWKSYRSAYKRP